MTRTLLCLSAIAAMFAVSAVADDYVITIKDHQFSPKELTIPANTKVKITVKNQDATPEEFESHDLKREKIVKGNSEIVLSVGPLEPGSYKYFGEFHEDTAKGVILVK